MARLTGDGGLLTPLVVSDIVHGLIRFGNSYHLLRAGDGGLFFDRAQCVGINGSPRSWRYQLDIAGPDTSEQLTATPDDVLHVRQHAPLRRPWEGRSSLDEAASTGTLARALEHGLGHEAAVGVGRILTHPTGMDDKTFDRIAGQIAATLDAPRRIGLVETTRQGHGVGASSAPAKDLVPERLGPEPMPATVSLFAQVYRAVMMLHGIPPAIAHLDGTQTGQALREGVRILKTHTLMALARLIEQEASRLLRRRVVIDLDLLDTPDVSHRAMALSRLVVSGMSIADAREAVGL
ncbi:MAG: phage portal protein [Acidobacteria bacterium]|nr:phage portal protein [Acidobacteriota bacterium]